MYDGPERRHVNPHDHDLLTRIDANLSNHISLVETHIQDDKTHFKKIDDDLGWIRKILYGGLGVIATIEFLSRFMS